MRIRSFVKYMLFLSAMLFCIADAFAAKRTYAANSVLASGKWVKIKVQDEGIYQFNASDLKAMGFSNPRKVHIYGYGGELLSEEYVTASYIDDLPEVPTYWNESGQRLVFYLRGTMGYKLNTMKATKARSPLLFEENYTSDYSYYFVTENNTEPLRIVPEALECDADAGQIEDAYKYKAISVKKFDDTNLLASGRNWFGDMCEPMKSKNYKLYFRNMVAGDTAEIIANMISTATVRSGFYLKTSIERGDTAITSSGNYVKGRDIIVHAIEKQSSSNTLDFEIKYDCTQTAGRAYTDYLQGTASCWLNANNPLFVRRLCPSDYQYTRFHFSNAKSDLVLLDISRADSIKALRSEVKGDSAVVVVRNDNSAVIQRFVSFSPSSVYPVPTVVGEVRNQNLHALRDIEYVVISPAEFASEANRLADIHKVKDGLSSVVLTQEAIFNEFSSGTPDPTAIRAFMKMLYDKAKSEKGIMPRYLLLFGDGCYDNKNNANSSLNATTNRLITYQSDNSFDESKSYTCDHYFTYLEDDSKGYHAGLKTNNSCVGVGRIPAMTQQQAKELVDKIEAYLDNSQLGSWKNKVVFMADDNDAYNNDNSYHTFAKYSEELVSAIEATDKAIESQRIYWDAYNRVKSSGSSRYPEVESKMREWINGGALMFNYCGHGSFNSMSAEHPFAIVDAANQYNKKLGLWYAASCNVGQFDGYVGSLGEEIMRNPNGTGIATIAAVRTSYASSNQELNKAFIEELFRRENGYVLGEAFRIAQNRLRPSDTNKLVYHILGDPALRLVFPMLEIKTDSVFTINADGEWSSDKTLSALDRVKIVGSIYKDNGDVDDSFNGEVIISVKDKEQVMKTKGNNSGTTPLSYKDYVNTLYSGSAEVVDGRFECQLIVPKDINYSLGNGRITYYAFDEVTRSEALGYDNSIEIGGTPSVTEFENAGPKITAYLNDESFRNGGKVNVSPMLYVGIADESGINASGCGIGHDISLYIDDSSEPIILNSRFIYSKGSSTDGFLTYHLPKLSSGRHTLTIKAWDLVNNSSTQIISFVVDESLAPSIGEIVAYPLPAREDITFEIPTNRPDEVINCVSGVYDFNGRQYYSSEFSSQPIDGTVVVNWDLTDGKGHRLPSGTYIYRVELNTNGSESEIKTKKFLILPTE